jgi:hypothetical protein
MPESAELDRAALETVARAALTEFTPAKSVGALRDLDVVDDVATVRFSTTQGGYPGWTWTVSIAVNPGMEPAVLETELMPGEGALLAPEWVPWSDRLEEYLAQQAESGEPLDADGADGSDDDDDDDDDDDEDDDLDDDVDGVDIDLHADSADDDDTDLGDDDDDDDDADLGDDEDDEDDDDDDDDDDELIDEDDEDDDEDDIDRDGNSRDSGL